MSEIRRTSVQWITGKRREKGYVLFTMAGAIIAICGFAGLVMDVGYAEYIRRQAQAAADAGAKAAALEIVGNKTTQITDAAKQDTANNGFTDGKNDVTITVNHPPLYGSYASNGGYAEVIVQKNITTNFMSILGFPSMTVAARSVGGGGPSGACIYALAGTDTGLTHSVQDAILASGGANVDAGCGIVDESTHSKGLETTGGSVGSPTCITGSTIQIVGNYNGSCISPVPTTGITSPGDPFTGKFTRPTPAACTATNWHNNASTLSQGTYCGGITVDSSHSVTASAGTYILYGGGLTVSGGGNLSGSNVTFINMDSGSLYGGYKPISVTGGSATQLSAPTSGAYEGLLFWQDPNIPSTNWNKQNTVSGTSSSQFQGILYFPDSPLVYSGGSSGSSQYTIIVADTVTFSGASTYVNANYSSLSSGSPIKTTAIVAE